MSLQFANDEERAKALAMLEVGRCPFCDIDKTFDMPLRHVFRVHGLDSRTVKDMLDVSLRKTFTSAKTHSVMSAQAREQYERHGARWGDQRGHGPRTLSERSRRINAAKLQLTRDMAIAACRESARRRRQPLVDEGRRLWAAGASVQDIRRETGLGLGSISKYIVRQVES